MMKSMINAAPLASALALAGCATLPTDNGLKQMPPSSYNGAYMGLGTEPGWTLEITPGQLNYNGNYGDTQFRLPVTAVSKTTNGMRYDGADGTHAFTAEITYKACSDGMSDRRYAHELKITADGQTYQGCGGGTLPPVTLENTAWRIEQIGNTSLSSEQGQKASFRFGDGRVDISVGCNGMSGVYQATNHAITIGPLISTRKGCPAELAKFESDISALLENPVHMRYTPDGQLSLLGTRGARVELRQII